jgi:hypothetical protein
MILMLSTSACSVYKASSNEGISVSDVEDCRTRLCLLSQGMKSIDRKEVDGKVVELYRAVSRKSGANYLRAAGHGVLDVFTLGLWEVAATPIEGAMDSNRGHIIVKAVYADQISEDIEGMEIVDEQGKIAYRYGAVPKPKK